MKLAVVIPTRGLVFTEVEEQIEVMRHSVVRQNEKVDMHVFYSNDLPIPDAQNTLVEKALAIDPEYVLFIEEDTIPITDTLAKLIACDADIAFVDYGVNGWSCSARSTTGTLLWCGFGCTLIKRHIFDALAKPYFRTDKTLRLNDWTWQNIPMKYGGQDIWFCCQARKAGFKLVQATGECRHMKLSALGRSEVNNGKHIIEQKSVIKRRQEIIQPEPVDPRILTIDRSLDHNDVTRE